MATQYLIALPGDEDVWEQMGPEEREKVFDRHREFSEQLAARGHEITGGAELEHSKHAKVVRAEGSGHVVTDGPYAETTEQLSGFYIVASDDLDDLLDVCKLMTFNGGVVEVRRLVDESGS
ncbi:YciI family protein [Aeromicrobium phragmitis]|nr:YciI family protein [Aeromicrobium phragmitis]